MEGKRKRQSFRRKEIREIMCNSFFKTVLGRDLCQHNVNITKGIQNNVEKNSEMRGETLMRIREQTNTQQINKKEAMWGASQMLGKDSIIISSEW